MVKRGFLYDLKPRRKHLAGALPAWSRLALAPVTKRLLVAGSLLLGTAGCYSRGPGTEEGVREYVVMSEDFEQLDGWLAEPAPSLTTERAHSGRYSVKTDKDHPYSITYRLTLSKAFTMRPHRVRLSTWAWVDAQEDDAQLVFALNPPDGSGNSLLTSRIYLADDWPYKRWVHLSRYIDLPPEIPSKCQIIVYLWHAGAQNAVFTDDWELTEIH
jgi:hypothetical protein